MIINMLVLGMVPQARDMMDETDGIQMINSSVGPQTNKYEVFTIRVIFCSIVHEFLPQYLN